MILSAAAAGASRTAVPSPAQAVGYTHLTTATNPQNGGFNSSTVTTDMTASGFPWYVTPGKFTLESDLTILVGSGALSVTGDFNGTQYWGTLYGKRSGGGWYAEAEVMYNGFVSLGTNPSNWWSFFAYSGNLLQGLGRVWSGFPNDQFGGEFDISENFGTPGNTGVDNCFVHAWYYVNGVRQISGSPQTNMAPNNPIPATLATQYHKVGGLWVPPGYLGAGSNGYLQKFWDRSPVGTKLGFPKFDPTADLPPPPTAGASWPYGIFDNDSYSFALGGVDAWPMRIRSFSLWQKP